MKKLSRRENKCAPPIVAAATGKLAETVWFVSSFVMSLIMGPFAALPALIAIFSLKIEGPLPLELPR
jgi:hypothetical protein